ncbi:iron hydrogenase [Lipomyces tetrasporus]|uniref:Cytosolic Fe-S cluster assembly factor NAR1 n=1 Tax=Lipomyces tetrasporus TaxID=54092 RepID=A0AAD7VU54_9ASCO|nr:iron hydrogenase [Lipomyces tetrasporus]KAJ8102772.1 iron hydrogenase [Lipomyces tetrasporus]
MSAILSAQDLNDFIGPGLACINPVVVNRSDTNGPTEIQIDSSGNPVEVSVDDGLSNTTTTAATQLTPAQINLSDCLACSGCITSAESVLVSLQSHTELLSVLRQSRKDPKQVFVASISHQSRASLSAAFNISVDAVDAKLVTLFRDILGFQYLVGTGVGRQVSLAYSAQEVLLKSGKVEESNGPSVMHKRPVLASICPGWICYVEKTHPHVLPYLSAIKSPQQITGSLLKRLIRDERGVSADEIYHVSVMPCFDKKLEASRPDFATGDGVRDVDCVITTKEVVQLLLDENMDFMNISEAKDARTGGLQAMAPKLWPVEKSWESSDGSSSGGYLWHVLAALGGEITKSESKPTDLKVVPGKNSDMVEYHLVAIDGDKEVVVGKAAQVYGFRNIQNLVRKLKTGGKTGGRTVQSARAKKSSAATSTATLTPTEYDYIEVMACPGGCINGGGQIGAPTTDGDAVGLKEWRDMVETKYRGMRSSAVDRYAVQDWAETIWGSDIDSLVTTSYRAVEGFDAKDGVPAVLVGDKW